jgi:hypothetical protein
MNIQLTEIQMTMTIPTTRTKPNRGERNELVVNEDPDIQSREKLYDDANHLSEEKPRVKYIEKHASLNNTIYYLS